MHQKIITALLILILASCNESTNTKNKTSVNVENSKSEIKETPNDVNSQEKNPKWIVEQIFLSANTGDFSILVDLCDPIGEVDINMQRLCRVPLFSKEKQEDFMSYFKTGIVIGEPIITDDQAAIKVKFGYDGTREETFKMVRRDGKWYLSSFEKK